MKVTRKIVMSLIGAAGVALAGTALAHPGGYGGMGRGMGPGMMGGMGACAAAGAEPSAACPMMGAGAMQGGGGCALGGPGAAQGLMTDEERQAFAEKMRSAKTHEERHKLALENRTEMQKRATERGIELPPMSGPRMGHGGGPGMGRGWGHGAGYGWGPGPMRGNTPEAAR